MFRVLFHREVLAAFSLSVLIVCATALLGLMYARLGHLVIQPVL